MGVFTVGEGVIEGDAQVAAIHLDLHRIRLHGQHAGRRRISDAAVMLCIGQDRFGVIVVHVLTDPCAYDVVQGVSGHDNDWFSV